MTGLELVCSQGLDSFSLNEVVFFLNGPFKIEYAASVNSKRGRDWNGSNEIPVVVGYATKDRQPVLLLKGADLSTEAVRTRGTVHAVCEERVGNVVLGTS